MPRRIATGPDSEQAADLYAPEGEPRGTALVVHGGFWRARFTRANSAALAIDLARRGYETWNIEYRRVGAGGGIPATLDDVTAAAALAPASIAIGHSAGGHLALWLAGTGHVRAAVSLAGVCDLVGAARAGLGDNAAIEFAGGSPEERQDAYRLANPMARLPTSVRQLLVHGDADDRVPVMQSRRYAEAARAAGDRCELLELHGVGHFELIDPRSEAWAAAAAQIQAL